MFIQEDVLQFQVTMDARLAVNVGNCADKLSEDFLYFTRLDWSVVGQVVVKLIACMISAERIPAEYEIVTWTVF